MKSLITAILATASIAFYACNNEDKETTTTTDSSTINKDSAYGSTGYDSASVNVPKGHAEATLTGTVADTALTGTVRFDTAGNKVKMVLEVRVESMPNKQVAVHLHEHGDCGDRGNMSHGHWNPTNAQHGRWGSASFHRGDIGNVKLDSKGQGMLTIETDLWSIGGASDKNILGKAVIVHSGVDDYKTQPTGNAGSRIGCGVIQ